MKIEIVKSRKKAKQQKLATGAGILGGIAVAGGITSLILKNRKAKDEELLNEFLEKENLEYVDPEETVE